MPEDMQEREGIPPYAQRDVEHAVNRAMGSHEWKERVRAGLSIPNQAGGAMESRGPFEERREQERGARELDRNIEALIRRSRAQAEYDPTLEVIRRHRNIYAIRSVVMREVAEQMRTLDEFDDYRLRLLKQTLRASGRSLTISDDKIDKYNLDKYGFGGTPKQVKEAIELRLALFEAEALYYEGEAKKVADSNPDLAQKYTKEADNYRQAARLEEEIHEDELKDFPRDEQIRHGENKELLAEAIRVLEKINTAYFLHNRAEGDMPTLVQLFIDNRYAGISSYEWQVLLSVPKTEFEERYSFGEKIDRAMRLLVLIGVGGGEITTGDKVDSVKLELRKNQIKETIARIEKASKGKTSWIEGFITESDIEFLAGKNLFCDAPNQTRTELVRQWIREKIGGDSTDTRLAEGIAWRLFYMWGLAPQFDSKVHPSGIEVPEGDLKKDIPKDYPLPSGTPDTNDLVKVYHYNSFLYKDAWRKRPHGPDATLGQYPEHMLVSFLHSTTVGKGENRRSFWERWMYESEDLGNLPWSHVADEHEAQMIEKVMENIASKNKNRQTAIEENDRKLKEARRKGDDKAADEAERRLKEERAAAVAEAERIIAEVEEKGEEFKSIGTYSWRGYLLKMYMLGREAGREPDKPGGVFQIASREEWKADDLVNLVTLRAINKALGIGWDRSILGLGEWAKFFEEEREDYEQWAKEQELYWEWAKKRQRGKSGDEDKPDLWDSYIGQWLDNEKEDFRRLVLLGALTSAYQNAILRDEATLQWGLWRQEFTLGSEKTAVAKRREKDIPRLLINSGFIDKETWDRIVKEADLFLKAEKVI